MLTDISFRKVNTANAAVYGLPSLFATYKFHMIGGISSHRKCFWTQIATVSSNVTMRINHMIVKPSLEVKFGTAADGCAKMFEEVQMIPFDVSLQLSGGGGAPPANRTFLFHIPLNQVGYGKQLPLVYIWSFCETCLPYLYSVMTFEFF